MIVAAPRSDGSALKLSQFFRVAASLAGVQAQIWLPDHVDLGDASPWLPLLNEGFVRRSVHPAPALLILSDAADWKASAQLYGSTSGFTRLHLLWGADLRCWGHGAQARPAVRLAMGEGVARALSTAQVFLESIHTLPIGLDPEDLPAPSLARSSAEVLILAGRNPGLGLALQERLRQRAIQTRLECAPWPMQQWLTALRDAAAAVVLSPPAGEPRLGLRRLAAMALQTPLICDQSADEHLCRHQRNALITPADPAALAEAVQLLLEPAAASLKARLIDGGLATLVRHRRARERLEFLQVLENHGELMATARRCHADATRSR
jgi:hypothetical protein